MTGEGLLAKKVASELRVECTQVRGSRLRNLANFYFAQVIAYDKSINASWINQSSKETKEMLAIQWI